MTTKNGADNESSSNQRPSGAEPSHPSATVAAMRATIAVSTAEMRLTTILGARRARHQQLPDTRVAGAPGTQRIRSGSNSVT